jgi:hypothetical protein
MSQDEENEQLDRDSNLRPSEYCTTD